MPLPIPSPSYSTLSAMITPAIFLTANGSLIMSTSNRMSRVVDRIRVLNEKSDRLCRGQDADDYPSERVGEIRNQIDRLVWRGDRIRRALVLLYLAFGSFVGTSLALAIDDWTGNLIVAFPTVLAIAGVGFMLGACVNLVREALEAIRSNRAEIDFYRGLHERRQAEGRDRVTDA